MHYVSAIIPFVSRIGGRMLPNCSKEEVRTWQDANYVTKPDKPGIESVLQEARFQEGPTEFGKRM